MRIRWIAFLIVLIMAPGFTWQWDSRLGTEGGIPAAAAQTKPQEVKVGVILGLTGQYSQYGKRMKAGYDLALQALEREPGKYRITLIEEDSKFDPATAVRAYQQLRNVRRVSLFAGITGSKNAAAVCAAAASHDVVILDALSSAPSLTPRCGKRYFRIMPSDALAGKYDVDWAVERGLKKFAIVHVLDDWGNSYAEQISRYLSKKGLRLVLNEGINPGQRDYTAAVRKIEGSKPEGLFLLLYASDGAAFMQQLRTRNQTVQVFGSDNLSTDEFLAAGPSVVEGTALALPATVTGPANDALKQAYTAKFGASPPEGVEYDINVTKAYDALLLLAQVIEKAGPKPAAIREYLRKMGDYASVSGPIRFDANGDLATVTYQRFEFRDGKRVPAAR